MAALVTSILAQKGGTRKSTLARALAVAYTKGGWVTRVADMDADQTTVSDWNKRREARDLVPAISVQMHPTPASAVAAGADCDLLIIDGKGFASKETAEVAKASDLVLIPTGTGLDDLQPSVRLGLLLVQQHGIDPARILFPLTNMGNSLAEVADARAYLEKAGFAGGTPGFISIKTCFSKAHDQGRAITEVTAPGPKKQANDWIRGIIAHIDQLTD